MDVIGRACAHHPDRKGVALCKGCGAVLCPECTTLRDGIHYCARCLRADREEAGRRSGRLAAVVQLAVAAAALALAGLGLRGLLADLVT